MLPSAAEQPRSNGRKWSVFRLDLQKLSKPGRCREMSEVSLRCNIGRQIKLNTDIPEPDERIKVGLVIRQQKVTRFGDCIGTLMGVADSCNQ